MEFHSYKDQVLAAMKLCREEFCERVGALVVAEAQSLTPVLTGNLRRSEVYEVMENNEGVNVGVTPDILYGLTVEKGSSTQEAQPYLEPGAINSIDKITKVAEQLYRDHLDGDI